MVFSAFGLIKLYKPFVGILLNNLKKVGFGFIVRFKNKCKLKILSIFWRVEAHWKMTL